MKQNITLSQKKELSDKAWAEYTEWCHKQGYVIDGIVPLFSIGQMIQFLYKHNKSYLISYLASECFEEKYKRIGTSIYAAPIPNEKVFCDELWSACKEVLEQ